MVFDCKIGDEYYDIAENYSISQQTGAIASSDIDVLVADGQSIPVSLQSVTLYDSNDLPFFHGIIQSVVSPSFSSGYEVKRYRISVNSIECILNNRLVSEAYENKYTHEIVQDLFTNYIAAEGITLGSISNTDQLYENYNCSFTKLYDILSELAEDINANFYISPDKKFYFLTQEGFNYVEKPAKMKMININEDAGEMRNVQIVTGASEETSTQTENNIWVANQSVMVLSYQIASIVGITINGTPAGVGIQGIDEDDITKTFLWRFGDKTVSVNYNATVKPTVGQNVVVLYTGFFDIVITNINDQLVSQIAALNGTSGRIENVFTDETLDNLTDANAKANALLSQFSEKERELSVVCHDLTASGLFNLWQIDFPDLNIAGDFVICERSISDFGETILINVKLKSKNFYNKYGTVLKKETKKSGVDVKVYKQTSIGDTVTVTENLKIDTAGILYYPTTGSTYIDGLTIPFTGV